MNTIPPHLLSSRAIKLSLGLGITLFLIQLFQWVFPFPLFMLVVLLQLGLFCLFGIVLVWSIVHAIRQFRRLRLQAFLPALINAIVLLMLLYFPFLSVWLKLNFAVMRTARTEVVSLVKSGQLSRDQNGQLTLPAAYGLTSEGGQIAQENGDILFYTFRGIDNYAGFVHLAGSPAPKVGETRFYGRVINVETFEPDWFWISAT